MSDGPDFARRCVLRRIGAGAITFTGMSCLASGDEPASGRLKRIREFVEPAMAKWEVPGLALAVVKDGNVILAQGFGVRLLGRNDRVDADTVFPIASCTKSFTAAAIARLVDQGRLQWDDAIVRHLPSFRLITPELTSKVTIRHALSHRSGLPTANMLWRSELFGSDEIVSRLERLPPVAPPGDRFRYNNNLYLVLGRLVERVSGLKWADFLRNEITGPLGMTSTLADSSGLRPITNAAAPHAADNGKLQEIARYCPDVIAPAGAIHSSAREMAKWLTMHLGEGSFNGRRILSATRLEELHAPPEEKAELRPEDGVPRAPISRYGLGWFFNDYAGWTVVEHSGTQNGFVSWTAMIPSERLGLVVLTNHHRTGLNSALRSWIVDAVQDRPERDWSEAVRSDYTNGYQRLIREAKARFDAQAPVDARPELDLAKHAGQFESPVYGRLQVTFKDNRLRLTFGGRFESELQFWGNNSFRAQFKNPRLDDWLVTFAIADQRVTKLQVKEAPWAPDWYDDDDDLGEFVRL